MKTINTVKSDIIKIAEHIMPLPAGASYGTKLRYAKTMHGEWHSHALALYVNFDHKVDGKRTTESAAYDSVMKYDVGLDLKDGQLKGRISRIIKTLNQRGFHARKIIRGNTLEILIAVNVHYRNDDMRIEMPDQNDKQILHSVSVKRSRHDFYHYTARR